ESQFQRENHLRRNRVAASRCRKKQKESAGQLQEAKVELEQRNVTLHKEYKGLVDEVQWIKHQVMAHAGCNDSNIDKWIGYEAEKVVSKSLERRVSI
ncbi:hypothetical protein BGZ63DRAFT_339075, partial [Mariannaea sp. PMI_226]